MTTPSTTAAAVTAAANATARRYAALFVTHGGGPMPLLGQQPDMRAAWQRHAAELLRRCDGPPKAIVVVSAHYETEVPSVGGAAHPKMLYDFSGFPKESYELSYPAPGDPALAAEIVRMLHAGGFADARVEPNRPFDHGVFVPLIVLSEVFGTTAIPVIPVSVLASQDAAEHIRLGRALAPLRERDILLVGSGSSFHHFGNMHKPGAGTTFNDAVTAVLCDAGKSSAERIAAMERVTAFPGFDEAHPRGGLEHLMPLLAIVGATEGGVAREAASCSLMRANTRDWWFD